MRCAICTLLPKGEADASTATRFYRDRYAVEYGLCEPHADEYEESDDLTRAESGGSLGHDVFAFIEAHTTKREPAAVDAMRAAERAGATKRMEGL